MISHRSRFASILAIWAVSLSLTACSVKDAVQSNDGTGGLSGGGNGNTGGSSSAGNGNQAGSATTLPSPTAGCMPWPAAKLLPYVGPFFYGDVNGPCRVLTTNTDGTSLELLTYDANGQLATIADDAGTWQSTVTWEGGLPKTIMRTGSGAETVTFEFGPTAVVETHLRPTPSTSSQYAYILTAEGYPSTVAIGVDPAGNGNYTVNSYVHYEYVDCRINRRCRGTSATELHDCLTFDSYEYDSAGRMILRSTATGPGTITVQYEYECSN